MDWLTPEWLLNKADRCLGGIELDPCASLSAPNHVPAHRVFTLFENGLALPWQAETVYCNPPYSRGDSPPWAAKILEEFNARRAKEILALLPARTDTEWFQSLTGWPICLLRGRVRFQEAGKEAVTVGGGKFPSVLVYLGHRPAAFHRTFKSAGTVYLPANWSQEPGAGPVRAS